MRIAASTLNVTLISVPVRNASEFDDAFAAMMRERPDAFVMTADPLHQLHIKRIVDFLAQNRLLGMFQLKENVGDGALMSYGASLPDLFGAAPHTYTGFCRAPGLRICRWNRRLSSSWSSTSRPRRRRASRSRELFILRADEVIE